MDCDIWFLQNAVVRGTLLGFQYMGKDKGGKGGVLVNMASTSGLNPTVFLPVYVTTKHAVIGLSRSFGVSTVCNSVGTLY
jgi:15-hydroxyprostaglandin dehydrogenase (NAD)